MWDGYLAVGGQVDRCTTILVIPCPACAHVHACQMWGTFDPHALAHAYNYSQLYMPTQAKKMSEGCHMGRAFGAWSAGVTWGVHSDYFLIACVLSSVLYGIKWHSKSVAASTSPPLPRKKRQTPRAQMHRQYCQLARAFPHFLTSYLSTFKQENS